MHSTSSDCKITRYRTTGKPPALILNFSFHTFTFHTRTQMLGGVARSRRHRTHHLVERKAVGYYEAAWQGFHTSNGIDALLHAAQTGSPWTKHSALCGQPAHRPIAAQLRTDSKQIRDRWEQIHQHRTHLLWVWFRGAHLWGFSKGGKGHTGGLSISIC